MEESLKIIAELSPVVAEVAAEATAAVEAEQQAEAELLTRVVGLVKPALRALGTRPKVAYYTWWVGTVRADEEYKFLPTRALYLAPDDKPGPARRGYNDGCYEGRDLFLGEDGLFYTLTYSGHWSNWQGSGSKWEAQMTRREPLWVVQKYELDGIINTVTRALQAQSTAKRPTAAALARAERLNAVLKLI